MSYQTLILILMKKLEHRVLRALIFFTIMLFGYQLMFAIFLPFLAPPEFLNNFKFIGFTITFFGLHTFLALCTFIFSRLPISNQLSLLLLIASIVIPLAYLIYNFSYCYIIMLRYVRFRITLISFNIVYIPSFSLFK